MSYQNRGTRAAASKHYGTMTVDQLKKMGVELRGGGIANSDCALFMWATFPMLREALEVIEAWGFTYKTVAFNWVKQNKDRRRPVLGPRQLTRSILGDLPTRREGQAETHERQRAQRHPLARPAAQPQAGRGRDRIVELMGDLPRIELFAREAAPGWDAWGDEAPAPDARKEETDGQNDPGDPAPEL